MAKSAVRAKITNNNNNSSLLLRFLFLNILLLGGNFFSIVTPASIVSYDNNKINNNNTTTTTTNSQPKAKQVEKLLVISFDGFRQLYLANDRFMPWFSYFRSQGVYSDLIQSIFPSETFPNHYAIVTGRYAESHGIVANDMYDPDTGDHFTVESTDDFWWNETEPIWITARKQNIRTAVSFWPGSAVVFPGNMTADYYRPIYDTNVPYQVRIDEVLGYLAKDEARLGLLYYNRPDVEGHYNGVDSPIVATTLSQLDWYLSYILESAKRLGLGPDVLNIVICADHGMANITTQLYIDQYTDLNLIERVPSYGAVTNVQPKAGQLERVYNDLSRAASKSNGLFRVYKKEDVPAEFHYSNNDRIMDIVIIGDVGVYMSPNESSRYRKTASHGYDPKLAQMRPIFMANGPAFKKGGYKAQKTFRTKDIYAIMSFIIGLEPYPNNSTFDDVADIFSPQICCSSAASSFTSSPFSYNNNLPLSLLIALLLPALISNSNNNNRYHYH